MHSLKSDSQSSNGLHDRINPGPDMVQDMVEHSLMEFPLAFIQPPHERALLRGITQTPGLPLLVIDMAMLQIDGLGKKTVLPQTIRACEEWGFFQVVNHGMPETLMGAAMDMTKRFYALSTADRAEFKMGEGASVSYGWYFKAPGAPKDWVDHLVLITVYKDASEEAYDIVLNTTPDMHQVLAVQELERKILSIFSESLGRSQDFLCNKFADISQLLSPMPTPRACHGMFQSH